MTGRRHGSESTGNGINNMIRTTILYVLFAFLGIMDLQADNASALQMVFVDPYSGDDNRAGTSWKEAIQDIQTGVNMAHRYYSANHCQTYVLVKGSKNAECHTGQSVIMRDGVAIIGSIGGDAVIDYDNSGDYVSYINKVSALRDGIASPSAYKTMISGIVTDVYAYGSVFRSLVDGFVVSPVDGGGVGTHLIDVENAAPALLCLRNIIVNGYTQAGGDVVSLRNALLYEALIRDNNCGSGNSLSLLDGAHAVNVTVEGNTSVADGAGVFNSLVNYDNDRVPAVQNTLTKYNYPVSDENLNYQLTERSKYIDACGTANPLEGTCFESFIDYPNDRDLLGNPRLLVGVTKYGEDNFNGQIDAGAFETWRIDKTSVSTSLTDNFYPHEGSAVYIMSGASLHCGADLIPSYLLVQEGASLYGLTKGVAHQVKASYVSIERSNMMDDGTVVGLPFAMDYLAGRSTSVALGVGLPEYSEDGVLSFKVEYPKVYTYNGKARSEWKYSFATEKSPCWTRTESPVEACRGVLYVRDNEYGNVFRFTAKGKSMSDYVYTEHDPYKQVALSCYNDYSASDNSFCFTDEEDMGWNCIGIPYLVSRYETWKYVRKEIHNVVSNSFRILDTPQIMWAYYNGKTDPTDAKDVEGDAGFYSVNSLAENSESWHVGDKADRGLWFGEGIFIQNPKWSGDELLTFYRPYVDSDWKDYRASSAKLSNSRYYYDGSMSNIVETADDDGIKVRVVNHTLFITNIRGEADFSVFTTNGGLELTDHTVNPVYSVSLSHGVHIINVNGKSYTISVE